MDLEDLRNTVEAGMELPALSAHRKEDKITLVKQVEKMLKITFPEAKLFKSPSIDSEHALLSMLKDQDNLATRAPAGKFKVDYEQVKHEVETILTDDGDAPACHGQRPTPQGPRPAEHRRR